MLVPYSWFQILWYFYIYGFLGWCSEVAFAAVAHGKFVNRGFVNGPICSIYGFGVMSVLLVLGPLKSSFWLLFGGSVLFTSAIEYLTGWVLEKVFHDKWWDYSKRPLNIKGYVCLEFSVLWGLACVFVVDVFQPLVAKVVDLIPKKLGWVLLGTFSALWIADNIITAMEIRKLPKKLRALQAIEDSLTAISDEIGEEIYIRTSDAKDRGMEVYTGMKEKSTELAQKRAEASIERRSELLARRSELLQRRDKRVPAALGDADGEQDEKAVKPGLFHHHAMFGQVFRHDRGGNARRVEAPVDIQSGGDDRGLDRVQHVEARRQLAKAVPAFLGAAILDDPVVSAANALFGDLVRAPDLEPPVLVAKLFFCRFLKPRIGGFLSDMLFGRSHNSAYFSI